MTSFSSIFLRRRSASPAGSPRTARRAWALLALVAAAGAGACTEQLESGAACPSLCPTTNVPVRDTVLDAVALDTTLTGFAAPGEARTLLVAVTPGRDSLDVRTILRFDSLPNRYFPITGGDSLAITRVDSGFLRLRLDTLGTRITAPTTLELFDVDTTAVDDTVTATLAPLFRAARRIGSVTLQPNVRIGDSLRVAVSNEALGQRIQGTRRLRVGLRLTSTAPAALRIVSASAGLAEAASTLSFDPATDTVYRPLTGVTRSATPANAAVAGALRDFSIVVRSASAVAGTDLVVGGLPARRSYLRFVVPPRLIDSATIVRATLELVQRPARGVEARDSVVVRPEAVLASEAVTDLRRAVDFVASPQAIPIDSARLAPADSGLRVLSVVQLVRAWRGLTPGTQRALSLRASAEGGQGGEIRFFSIEAPAALRPRLRLSYVPRTEFGLP